MLRSLRHLAKRHYSVLKNLNGFDPNVGVAASRTPPDHWYTDVDFFNKEKALVFGNARQTSKANNWIPLGLKNMVESHGNYMNGQFLDEPYGIHFNKVILTHE
jgi:hypothetical protein